MISGRWLAAGVTLVAAIAAAAYLLLAPRAPIPSGNAERPLPRAEFDDVMTQVKRWGLDDHLKEKSFDRLAFRV